jgi:hypothetical protein
VAGNYRARQGDHLSKIAKAFGLSDYHTISDHPDNATLKQQRQNPNVLFPGDSLFVPDHEQKEESRSTNQKHRFKMNSNSLKLRLTLEDAYEAPLANAKCQLILGCDFRNLTTDGSGKIEQNIPADIRDASLTVQDAQSPLSGGQITIKIGDLDPVTETSGQIARLSNLVGDVTKPDQTIVESAVEEFQCDTGLT